MVEMDDLLSGGNGNDELPGRNNADKFECSDANDKITDFKASEGDKKTNDCKQLEARYVPNKRLFTLLELVS